MLVLNSYIGSVRTEYQAYLSLVRQLRNKNTL